MQGDAASYKTVVIIDDEAGVRTLVGALCAMHGYEVLGEAANGIDAEMLVQQHQPRFVVLDYMMPFQDGAVTARKIRRICPDARIIAVSAVIHERPEWADAFVEKTEIDSLGDVLDTLFCTAAA
jgi:DNA-binding NarL/FixJ family response regulator